VGTLGGVGICASANDGVNKINNIIAAISDFFISLITILLAT
jgi:hypothetical protein